MTKAQIAGTARGAGRGTEPDPHLHVGWSGNTVDLVRGRWSEEGYVGMALGWCKLAGSGNKGVVGVELGAEHP